MGEEQKAPLSQKEAENELLSLLKSEKDTIAIDSGKTEDGRTILMGEDISDIVDPEEIKKNGITPGLKGSRAELPAPVKKKIAQETAAKMNVKIDEYNKRVAEHHEVSGEMDADFDDFDLEEEEDYMELGDEDMGDIVESTGVEEVSEAPAPTESAPIGNEETTTVAPVNAADDGEFTEEEFDDEGADVDSDPDVVEMGMSEEEVSAEMGETPSLDESIEGDEVPSEAETAEEPEVSPEDIWGDEEDMEEDDEPSEGKFSSKRTASDLEYEEYARQNDAGLVNYNNVHKKPRMTAVPTGIKPGELAAIIADRNNKLKESEDSVYGEDAILLHSGIVSRVTPLKQKDMDEIDTISDMSESSKSRWLRQFNFLYQHISSYNTGFSIADDRMFKSIIAFKDIPTIAFNIFKASYVDRAVPFSFPCSSEACKKASKANGNRNMVTHSLVARDMIQYNPDTLEKTTKKAAAIEKCVGNRKEWMKNTLKHTRERLNFTKTSGVLIEVTDLDLNRYLDTCITNDEERKLQNASAEQRDEIMDSVGNGIKNRVTKAYIRRMMVVNASGALQLVPKASWDTVLEEMLTITDSTILQEVIARIADEHMVKFHIKKAICPHCHKVYENIPINPLDLLFNIRATISRGWKGVEGTRS